MSRVFVSTFDDPFVNLALEACLLNLWQPGQRQLFLWGNRPCVVIGRFQNPWSECRMDLLERNNIPLVRRTSGGGSVYHDRGNLCFSFFNANWSRAKEENLDFIIATLKMLGIRLRRNRRHDLLHSGPNNFLKKVSGSAFRQKKDRSVHHGTLLVRSDLTTLKIYLSPHSGTITSRALPSTPSPVINLSDIKDDITVPQVREELARNFSGHITKLDKEFIRRHTLLYEKEYLKILGWKWRYGETPTFTQTLTRNFYGEPIRFKLKVHKGVIEKVSPAESPLSSIRSVETWQQNIVGKEYSRIYFL